MTKPIPPNSRERSSMNGHGGSRAISEIVPSSVTPSEPPSELVGPGPTTHVVYHACELQRALVYPIGQAARDAADQFSTGPSSWPFFPATNWFASGSGLMIERWNGSLLYETHELTRAVLGPVSAFAFLGACAFSPPSPFAQLPGGALYAAGYELLYRVTKDYPKPAFGIDHVTVSGSEVDVVEQAVVQKPFCRLLRFERRSGDVLVSRSLARAPVVLVVAPLSGHHATLLRDTVRTLLTDHDVYITDWVNAREVPLERGPFTLDDYVDYVRGFIRLIGAERLHVVSVCQPCVPVLGAAALLAAAGEPTPKSLILIGGPVDARRHPTQVNDLATTHSRAWFDEHLLQEVPSMYPGRGRRVYPGFLQHAGFIAMNPGRHMSSHWDFFRHLVDGDDEDAEAHRHFYDEYNSVIDLAGEYYLDCIRIVFQEFLLPRGKWYVRGQRVAPELLRDTALFTIEGERDDISGVGQTQAAQELCSGIPADRKRHLLVENVGHYGLFSGRRWRNLVYPRIAEFIGSQSPSR